MQENKFRNFFLRDFYFVCCRWIFIEVFLSQEISPDLKNPWLRAWKKPTDSCRFFHIFKGIFPSVQGNQVEQKHDAQDVHLTFMWTFKGKALCIISGFIMDYKKLFV